MRMFLRTRLRQSSVHRFDQRALNTVCSLYAKRTIASGSHSMTEESSFSAPALVLYNSLSQQKDPILPSKSNRGIACYCCGPTVYADAHLGHARTYVWFDIFRRVLEATAATQQAPPPLFVINITDVDDKILAAASENSNTAPLDHAREYELKFWQDMERLNCLRPHVVVRVSEYVEDAIIPYIQALVDRGMAYKVDSSTEGGVLFDVGAFEQSQQTYGKLVPNLCSSSDEEAPRVSPEHSTKRDPRDFALWKLKKPTESLSWASPWGDGRPGWHIECSAMIESVQKQFSSYDFRVHAGGIDLKFPHHTNEIAQAEAYNQCCPAPSTTEWIPHWMHTGHLHVEGLKMSKSLKNFITIDSQLKENEEWADDFRLWCFGLSGSYKDATTYSRERIEESRNVRTKIVRFMVTAERWLANRKQHDETSLKWSSNDVRFFELATTTRCEVWRSLLDDLDGPACLAALVHLIEEGNVQMQVDGARYEPVETAVDVVRGALRLVGFGRRSYNAGLTCGTELPDHDNKATLDEFTKFRSSVRRAAIADRKEGNASEHMTTILEACDHLRERVFPSMGVELIDKRLQDPGSNDEWQYCVRRASAKDEGVETDSPSMPPSVKESRAKRTGLDVDPRQLFRCGDYAGFYSTYDERGIPTKLADGTEVSKSQTKKLRKVMEKYERFRHGAK